MTIRRGFLAALSAALLLPAVAVAQSGDDVKALRQEIESLKAGIGAVQRDVQEIKTMLQGALGRQAGGPPPAVAPVSLDLSIANSYIRGAAGARLVLVEFSDFQCPFCGRHAKQTLPQIEREYVETGKIRYVMRNLPLDFHPDALRAASAAECAGDQGKYWQMHEKLFGNQQALSPADLERYAKEVGVDPGAFSKCFAADAHADKINKDLAEAKAAGIGGTPTFFLGFAEGSGKIKAVRRIEGAHPFPVFKSAIDGLLAEGAKK